MKNKLYYGDNLTVLRSHIQDESVDLCYIDPPFNSKRNYHQIYNNTFNENKAQAFTDIWMWNDHAHQGLRQILSNDNGVFTNQCIDLIRGLTKVLKKGSLLAYLVSMTLRIAEIQRILKPTGSFYLHCDPTASHYLKLVLDALFCAKGGNFRNEIIWGYIAPSAAKKDFPKKHDVIFRYTKSDRFIFNADAIRIPYSEKFIKRRTYSEGQSGIYSGKSIDRSEMELRNFAKGKLPPSWWTDIKSGGQMPRKELLGYPTQKPEALLERIIKASSHEGDVVLDAYCGCGTTVVVAEKLKRCWIGIDLAYQSISMTLKRLEDYHTNSLVNIELNGVPQDFESAEILANKKDTRVRKEFEKWLILAFSKNRAILNEKKEDDIEGIVYTNNPYKNESVCQKVLLTAKTSKTLTSTILKDFNDAIEREGATCGFLLTLYPMPHLVKESDQYGFCHYSLNGNQLKIQVISVEEIFNGKLME